METNKIRKKKKETNKIKKNKKKYLNLNTCPDKLLEIIVRINVTQKKERTHAPEWKVLELQSLILCS